MRSRLTITIRREFCLSRERWSVDFAKEKICEETNRLLTIEKNCECLSTTWSIETDSKRIKENIVDWFCCVNVDFDFRYGVKHLNRIYNETREQKEKRLKTMTKSNEETKQDELTWRNRKDYTTLYKDNDPSRIVSLLFVTSGWHLWTASDKETGRKMNEISWNGLKKKEKNAKERKTKHCTNNDWNVVSMLWTKKFEENWTSKKF